MSIDVRFNPEPIDVRAMILGMLRDRAIAATHEAFAEQARAVAALYAPPSYRRHRRGHAVSRASKRRRARGRLRTADLHARAALAWVLVAEAAKATLESVSRDAEGGPML